MRVRLLAGVVLVLSMSACDFVYTEEPSDSWSVYHSTEDGYRVDYPENFEPVEIDSAHPEWPDPSLRGHGVIFRGGDVGGFRGIVISLLGGEVRGTDLALGVVVVPGSPFGTPSEIAALIRETFGGYEELEYEPLILDGREAFEHVYSFEGVTRSGHVAKTTVHNVYVIDEGTLLWFNGGATEATYSDDRTTIERFVRSIRFD